MDSLVPCFSFSFIFSFIFSFSFGFGFLALAIREACLRTFGLCLMFVAAEDRKRIQVNSKA